MKTLLRNSEELLALLPKVSLSVDDALGAEPFSPKTAGDLPGKCWLLAFHSKFSGDIVVCVHSYLNVLLSEEEATELADDALWEREETAPPKAMTLFKPLAEEKYDAIKRRIEADLNRKMCQTWSWLTKTEAYQIQDEYQ